MIEKTAFIVVGPAMKNKYAEIKINRILLTQINAFWWLLNVECKLVSVEKEKKTFCHNDSMNWIFSKTALFLDKMSQNNMHL